MDTVLLVGTNDEIPQYPRSASSQDTSEDLLTLLKLLDTVIEEDPLALRCRRL